MQSCRIHAFIAAQLGPKFADKLKEGDVFIVEKFKVKQYNGDETNRAVRNDKHMVFTAYTKLEKDSTSQLEIPKHSFDFFKLEHLNAMKKDNRFLTGTYSHNLILINYALSTMFTNLGLLLLTDMVAIIEDVQPKSVYVKDTGEKSHVALTISDGRYVTRASVFVNLRLRLLMSRQSTEQSWESISFVGPQ